MTTLSKIKIALLAIVSLVLTIVVFQNLNETEVQLLFFKRSLPQAALLSVTLAIGFAMGFLTRELWQVRARRSKSKAANSSQNRS